MKTILLILNGNLTPYYVADTAIEMAKTSPAFLHTVFFSHSPALDDYNYPFPNDLSLTRNKLSGKIIEEEDKAVLADNIRLFEDKCKAENVDYFIEPPAAMTLGRLITISAFAECILADARQDAGDYHLADLLAGTHCPVLLVTARPEKQPRLLLTYDGSFSSMYAIKIFSLLFPEWKDAATQLVYVAEMPESLLPSEKYITGWLNRHYSNHQLTILQGDLSTELVNYTKAVPGSLVVMGSFGRNPVSRFFHESLANAVMEEGACSLFIAHP
jgi:hypothetical protein